MAMPIFTGGRLGAGVEAAKARTEQAAEKPPAVTYHHRFPDWNGEEEVEVLCERYLDELRKLVSVGIRQGFIQG